MQSVQSLDDRKQAGPRRVSAGLLQLMNERMLTQADLAQLVGLPRQVIQDILLGKTKFNNRLKQKFEQSLYLPSGFFSIFQEKEIA